MGNYYFLSASLPPLNVSKKPAMSFGMFDTLLKENLDPDDYEKTVVYRRLIDLHNIRAIGMDDRVDSRGNLSEKELDEALLTGTGLPQYVFDFLSKYDTVEERTHNFGELLANYFLEESVGKSGFLKELLQFERGFRLVLLGLRANELKRDPSKELQFEDVSNSIVAGILAQKDSDAYDPPLDFADLKEEYRACRSDTWDRHERLAIYRYNKMIEMNNSPIYKVDWLIEYMARLVIVEDLFYFRNPKANEEGNKLLETYTSR